MWGSWKQLVEKEESHQQELSEREESFMASGTIQEGEKVRELLWHRDKVQKGDVWSLWELGQENTAVGYREETAGEDAAGKELIWKFEEAERKEEIQHLAEQNIQLQVCWLSFSFGF